jgi:hypothetical protein
MEDRQIPRHTAQPRVHSLDPRRGPGGTQHRITCCHAVEDVARPSTAHGLGSVIHSCRPDLVNLR